jgi:hypothetical protein
MDKRRAPTGIASRMEAAKIATAMYLKSILAAKINFINIGQSYRELKAAAEAV